ncbi:MAG TPA: VOC family protein [Actinomycetota bacterium]
MLASGAMFELDHVILGVVDLPAASARLRTDLGLASVEGGRHVGVGTGNRIVPLGRNYVEVLAVADPEEARAHPFGRWVLDYLGGRERFLGWCLRTDGLDVIAKRLGLEIEAWSRERPDGAVLRWRMAGLDVAMKDPSLPFFMEWEIEDDLYPGRTRAAHAAEPKGFAWVEVAGDAERLAAWIGPADLPMRVVEGDPGIRAAGIRLGVSEAVLRPAP